MKKLLALFGVLAMMGAGCSFMPSFDSDDSDSTFYPTDLSSDVQEVYYDFSKMDLAVMDDNCALFLYNFTDYSGVTEDMCDAAFTAFNAGLSDDIDWEATEIEDDNAFIFTEDGELLTMLVLTDGDWLAFEDFWTAWTEWQE